MAGWSREAEALLRERFGRDNILALATVENGRPQVRYVNAYYENGAFYAITHGLSNKMRQLRENPEAALAGEWFTAHGRGEDLGYFGRAENAELAARLRTAFAAWIDNGHNDFSDENTRILRIRLTAGVLFSNVTRYDLDFGASSGSAVTTGTSSRSVRK